jgi:hypothetical protein
MDPNGKLFKIMEFLDPVASAVETVARWLGVAIVWALLALFLYACVVDMFDPNRLAVECEDDFGHQNPACVP